jgi:hypothetical protein
MSKTVEEIPFHVWPQRAIVEPVFVRGSKIQNISLESRAELYHWECTSTFQNDSGFCIVDVSHGVVK